MQTYDAEDVLENSAASVDEDVELEISCALHKLTVQTRKIGLKMTQKYSPLHNNSFGQNNEVKMAEEEDEIQEDLPISKALETKEYQHNHGYNSPVLRHYLSSLNTSNNINQRDYDVIMDDVETSCDEIDTDEEHEGEIESTHANTTKKHAKLKQNGVDLARNDIENDGKSSREWNEQQEKQELNQIQQHIEKLLRNITHEAILLNDLEYQMSE